MPTGCYELEAINAEIICICGNSDITIIPNVHTLQCILTVVVAKCKVSFDVPNSLASVFGFDQSICYSGTLQHHSFFIHTWYTSSSCLQFLPKCHSWTKDTRGTRQFNLPPSNCRHHFNFVSVVDGSTWKAVGFTWTLAVYMYSIK